MRGGIPKYWVKESVNSAWVPEEGRAIWNTDPQKEKNGVPFYTIPPLDGAPKCSGMTASHEKAKEILPYLKAYVKYLEGLARNGDKERFADIFSIIQYWERFQEVLLTSWETRDGKDLQLGFWPRTNHGMGYKYPMKENVESDVATRLPVHDPLRHEHEDEMAQRDEIYVGVLSKREREAWLPLEDVDEGKMIIFNPNADFKTLVPESVWVGKALGKVCRDVQSENFNKALITWWRPKMAPTQKKRKAKGKGKKREDDWDEEESEDEPLSEHELTDVEFQQAEKKRYIDCLKRNQWERDTRYDEPVWVDVTTCIYSWKSRVREDSTNPTKIPKLALEVINDHFKREKEIARKEQELAEEKRLEQIRGKENSRQEKERAQQRRQLEAMRARRPEEADLNEMGMDAERVPQGESTSWADRF